MPEIKAQVDPISEVSSSSGLPSAESRRRAILDASIGVIASGGVDSLTHRRVAAAAGVPLGSTTYYFRSREDLIHHAFRHYLDEARVWLIGVADEFPERDADSLVAYLVEVARREFADPGPVRAEYELILAASRDPELARLLHDWERTLVGRLAEWLEWLGADRPIEAARTLLYLMRGFELDRLTRPDATLEELETRLSSMVVALIRGARSPN